MSTDLAPGEHTSAIRVADLPLCALLLDADGQILASEGRLGSVVAPAAVGQHLQASLAPDLAAAVVRSLQVALREGREAAFEHWVVGDESWVSCRVRPVEGDPGRALFTAYDITRLKEAELDLARRLSRSRTLLAAHPDRLLILDREGRVLSAEGGGVHRAADHARLLGQRVEDLAPGQAAQLREAMDAAFDSGVARTVEVTAPGLEGGPPRRLEIRFVPLDPREAVAVLRDVNDRAGPASASEGLHFDVREVLERLPDVVLLHRLGKVIYVNQACADVLGYPSPADFVGRQMLDFIHPDDCEETLVRVRRMAETGQPLPPRELRTLRADGAVVVLELAPVRSVSLVDGPASLVLGRDRTPQRKLQERLLSADRLTSLGNLAAGVAHEISSPLTYVMGNLSVLSEALERMQATTDRPGEITDLLKALADARVGAERVRDLLADLKVFARPDVGARQALELRKVMDTAINMAWPEIRGLARLVRDYGPTPAVRGVESKLALAFFHLLVNAAQAIDAGAIDDNALEVGLGTDLEGWAEVEIRDSGRGLTEVVQARMWEPFFTTRPRGEGAGLGLPVVRSVVASMGGEVEGSPRARGGAVFRVRLPPDAAPLERSPQPEPRLQEAEPEVRSGRILVVDDEPVMGALMRRALAGHEVYILTSARDALELLEALEFDVLICDLVMPGQGGREIYEELSQRRPELAERIVFVTAGAVHAAEREFLERIRNIIVDKPFEFSELRAAVQAILRRS